MNWTAPKISVIAKPASSPTSSSAATSSGPTLAGASYGPPTGNSTSVANRPIPIRPGIGTLAEPSSGLKMIAPSTRTAART